MNAASPAASRITSRNRRLLTRLGVVALFMFGFGYALVPFYDQICRATGLRDIDRADAVKNTQVDMTRSVRVELDSNISKLPWIFKPEQTVVNVHPGEVRQILYDVVNTTDHPNLTIRGIMVICSLEERSLGKGDIKGLNDLY